MEYDTIVVERPDPRIVRIVMNRPKTRDAHNLQEFGMVVDPSGLHPSVRKPATAKQ